MPRTRMFLTASAVLAIVLAATSVSSLSGAGDATPETERRYGATVKLGNAQARTYVNVDDKTGASLEIGVAFDEQALEGLPTTGSGHHGGHAMPHTYILELPEQYAKPFKFVELNWNPAGHEPAGVYEGVPHFDFHFYTITQAEREAIVPTDPQFAAKANNIPASEYVPPFNAALAPPGLKPADVAVPKMGLHWVDVRSPELQRLLNKPDAYKPFTATFIHGSWDGRVTFWEPMITRAHILEKKTAIDPAVVDQIIPIPTPTRYQVPGYYPSAYRITWDSKAKEYRIALTQLTWQE